jgi:hypothetical protein
MHGEAPCTAEAWRLALNASKRLSTVTDPAYRMVRAGVTYSPDQWNDKILAKLPPIVARTLRCFGWTALKDDDTCRAQFRDMYEALAAKEHRRLMLPAAVQRMIDQIGVENKQLPMPESVRGIAGKIGVIEKIAHEPIGPAKEAS